ncbi:MAG: cell shape determination protein CcmA [Frankiales bacterium]|jgi:hypothetical protein|nr:cell shape determination protein CcmA [Frankiales bacterium]
MSRKTVGDIRRRIIVGTALVSTLGLVSAGLTAASAADPAITTVTAAVGDAAASGPLSGGTSAVRVVGTDLDKVTNFFFGNVKATHAVVESATLAYVTPPAVADPADTAAYKVNVSATKGGGLSTAADDYTYTAGPVVTEVKTVAKTVEITGAQLLGATAVLFGDTLVKVDTKKAAATATKVVVKAPSLKGGSYDVSVVSPAGIGTKAAAWGAAPIMGKLFVASEYGTKGAKTVSRASAATGTVGTDVSSTGTVVIATGSGFSGLKSLRFGKAEANFVVLSDTAVRAIVPPMSRDDVLDPKTLVTSIVAITATNGTGTTVKGLKFQYDALPTVAKLSDTVGLPGSATNTVTITGTHLDKAKIKIGKAGVKITTPGSTSVVLTIGKGTEGASESIVITTAAGTVTAPVKYTWKAAKTVAVPFPTS